MSAPMVAYVKTLSKTPMIHLLANLSWSCSNATLFWTNPGLICTDLHILCMVTFHAAAPHQRDGCPHVEMPIVRPGCAHAVRPSSRCRKALDLGRAAYVALAGGTSPWLVPPVRMVVPPRTRRLRRRMRLATGGGMKKARAGAFGRGLAFLVFIAFCIVLQIQLRRM